MPRGHQTPTAPRRKARIGALPVGEFFLVAVVCVVFISS
jgi:hypothetical protein